MLKIRNIFYLKIVMVLKSVKKKIIKNYYKNKTKKINNIKKLIKNKIIKKVL